MAAKQSASGKSAEARRVAAELRAQQQAASRRNTVLLYLGALVLAAAFAFFVLFIVQTGKESGPYTVYDNGELKVPSAADASGGIYVGPGGVAGGTPPEGAVRVDVYEDPICPWCTYYAQNSSREVEALVDQGVVAYYYHPVSILDYTSRGTFYSTRMAAAWATVAEYDPEHFMAFVKTTYIDPPEEGTKGLTNEEIQVLARQAGVSEDAIATIADGEFTRWVKAVTDRAVVEAADETGQFGTPTIIIGGVRFGYWTTPGNLTAAIAYVLEHGAEAFAEYLANPPELEPSPSPSA